MVNDDNSLGFKLDGADTVHPFIKSISFTVHWHVELVVDGQDFDHTTGSLRLKVSRNSVTVVSGSWPYMQTHYSTGKNFYTTTSITRYSDFVIE